MESSTYMNGEFINLYTAENPILEVDQECYGLIFNTVDFHYPLIIRGIIVRDKFVDGMNKQYYIRCEEICETPMIIDKYFKNKDFPVHKHEGETIGNKKYVNASRYFDFKKNLFNCEAYFVRNSLEKIQELRKEYISIVKQDLLNMVKDIDLILLNPNI